MIKIPHGGIIIQILIAIIPIICLLVCLLLFKLSALKASIIAFAATSLIYLIHFKSGAAGIYISLGKGLALALFVVSIVWGGMFLYNIVKESGALLVINNNIEKIIYDEFLRFILLAWLFSTFLQGMTGVGIPVIIVTPILISIGYDPVKSAAATLLGHAWSISFGSMGSSIFAIDMVTSASLYEIVRYMVPFGIIGMILMGLSVCFVYGGIKYMGKGIPYVLICSAIMGITMHVVVTFEMFSVISISTGFAGMLTLFLISVFKNKSYEKVILYKDNIDLKTSVFPYLLIIILSLLFYVINPDLTVSFSFPGYETLSGVHVPPETSYAKFNILKYPFTVIFIASVISSLVFLKKKVLNLGRFKSVLKNTVKYCATLSVTIILLLTTTVIMMDSGMIYILAKTAVSFSGRFYPLASPFIGLLGAFISGSNTNSNIIFGNLQEISANELGLNAAIICATQSVGASIGGAMGPTTVALGASAADQRGNEFLIYRKTMIPVFLTVTIFGIVNYFILL